MSSYVLLSIVLFVFIVPLVLGNYLGRLWRMPDYGWKFAAILFALLASVSVLYFGWPPKLGVDLSGGDILVYEVDPAQKQEMRAKDPNYKVDMDRLITAVSRRVNPGGQKEVTIRKYGAESVEITIPKVAKEEADRIKAILRRAGNLEFRILADERYPEDRSIIQQARLENTTKITDSEGNVIAWWVPVNPEKGTGLTNLPGIIHRPHAGDKREEILVKKDDCDVTGDLLSHASPDHDEKAQWCVRFNFSTRGGQLFGILTGTNTPDPVTGNTRQLGIILDGELYSAPSIQSVIHDQGQITGRFDQKETDELASVLNAGALPASLTKEPVSELYTGPTLGADTIRASAHAMIISSILVPLFMVWYYRFAGLVANIALVLNMIMLVAIMIAIKAAFTLPGLAGLALTVGMAVDNNVLIYERLREELHHGAAMRMAIRNAFHRAGVVIIDANVTHLIAATVLFVVGTEQVKGFAITFWLGAVLSIWATMFVARVMFEVAERRQWVTKINMMQVIGDTKFDFMHWFPLTGTISVLITVIGLAVALHRGKGLFDIDFTGGVSVETVYRQEEDIGEIRKKLDFLPDLAVSDVRTEEGSDAGRRFIINTSEADIKQVEKDIKDAFGDKLVSNRMDILRTALIEAAPPPKPAAEKPALEKPGTKPTPTPEKTAKEPVAEKPALSPTDKTAEKPVEKLETKPAEKAAEKPSEKAADKPSDGPAVKPGEKSAEPDGKQSRHDLPPDTVLAMAQPEPLALAQATEAAGKTAAEPAKEDAAKEPAAKEAAVKEPAAKEPAATVPATKEPATKEPAAKEKPAAEGPAKTDAKQPATAKTSPRSSQIPELRSPAEAVVNAYAGGTQADLKFDLRVNYDTISDALKAALAAHKHRPDLVTYELSLPDKPYVEGDTAAYDAWVLKIKLPPDQAKPVLATMANEIKNDPYFPGASAIGGAVAGGTRVQAVYALVASWVLIILYLWIRFQGVAFGVAAVIALIHDVLVMLGAIALSYYIAPWFGWLLIDPFKINLPIVAAFMTIIGYSVNDTIVVFDRVREVRGKDPRMTRQMINDSTNQTLSRTLLTSFTVLLVVIILYFFGGQAIHGFAFALIVGVLTGTYSSVYVAAPILLWLVHPAEMKSERSSEKSGLAQRAK